MGYRHIDVRRLTGALGAEIGGVDLSSPVEDAVFGEIHRAFLEHGVIFFRDQDLPPERQVALARRFGPPEIHPIVNGTEELPELVRVLKPAGQRASFGVGWHSDNSFFEKPSLGSLLYAVTVPPYGGDTLFAGMESAYEALSQPVRRMLDGLVAVHSASRAYDPAITGEAKYRGDAPITYRYSDVIRAEVEHPVIRTHPETGRRSIYVNPMFTQRIVGLTESESRAILGFLYAHTARPDFACRFRWEARSVAIWDNRCVQHYAMDDYREFERVMHRVTVEGDRPR
jgi:taurine dioxygenase